jgi:hypothetical protein
MMQENDTPRPDAATETSQPLVDAGAGSTELTSGFNGMGLGLGSLWRLSSTKTRSISAENPTGEKRARWHGGLRSLRPRARTSTGLEVPSLHHE